MFGINNPESNVERAGQYLAVCENRLAECESAYQMAVAEAVFSRDAATANPEDEDLAAIYRKAQEEMANAKRFCVAVKGDRDNAFKLQNDLVKLYLKQIETTSAEDLHVEKDTCEQAFATLKNFRNVVNAERRAEEAERRAEEAERCAKEAERRAEEAECRAEEMVMADLARRLKKLTQSVEEEELVRRLDMLTKST